ncbi:TRAP-type C4-dicarboxylate transport system substrate-binding protein [Neobacillus niacini]|uniref:TRAP transporter substrate-binding protein DctP n=1 Tax=Neobacillus niacini TaxID=86668 RepID=UPI002864A0B5|nr:TRAP transporter substrate-binding protein DctP [Neobacillus niacini]MDR7076139.1 TRAP-type C4-dicarboxylate transport system substrate-binding protein [Neobacillus niacini]
MLSKKYSILIGCLMVLLLIAAGCASKDAGSDGNQNNTEESKDPITLKLATWNSAQSYFVTEYLEPFMEEVTSSTDGRVQFKFYPAEQLGSAKDSLSMVAKGVVDISHFAPNYSPSEMPAGTSMMSIPGLYETTIQGATAYYNIAQHSPVLETEFLNNGVRPVSLALTPFFDIMTTGKKIKVPEDLEGLKIFAPGRVNTEVFNYSGATPVSMTASDLYTAFSMGVVDGVHFSYASADKFGLLELPKYAVKDLNMGASVEGLIINEEVFQNLPQDIQEVIMQVGEKMGKRLTEYQADLNTKLFEDMAESGKITTYEIPESEKEQWQKFYAEFKQHWIKQQDGEYFNKALEMFEEELEKLK